MIVFILRFQLLMYTLSMPVGFAAVIQYKQFTDNAMYTKPMQCGGAVCVKTHVLKWGILFS